MECMKIRRVSFVCIKNRKLLVALNEGKSKWYTPGGRVEDGETDEEALCREISEELGIQISTDSLRFYKVLTGTADEKTKDDLKVLSYFGSLNADPEPKSEITKLNWFSSKDKHLLSPVAQDLFASLYTDGLVN
jgi:8-oxo-dGTP diphosphatase